MTTTVGPQKKFDPRYVAFFERFNSGEYFEAHEVLESLWLETTGPTKDFYKGLIQTAVALLKMEQGKPEPAARLARRALSILEQYPSSCEGLAVDQVADLLRSTLDRNNHDIPTRPQLELRSP